MPSRRARWDKRSHRHVIGERADDVDKARMPRGTWVE